MILLPFFFSRFRVKILTKRWWSQNERMKSATTPKPINVYGRHPHGDSTSVSFVFWQLEIGIRKCLQDHLIQHIAA